MSKARPILFSAPMVRAILAGTKTQTRRIMNPQPEYIQQDGELLGLGDIPPALQPLAIARLVKGCRHGVPGDRLWVKETHGYDPSGTLVYRATLDPQQPAPAKWKPSIFMFRCDSRITLELTAVRAQRLQAISEEDARAEGVADIAAYRVLWDTINGAGSWERNPWLWVLSFTRVD